MLAPWQMEIFEVMREDFKKIEACMLKHIKATQRIIKEINYKSVTTIEVTALEIPAPITAPTKFPSLPKMRTRSSVATHHSCSHRRRRVWQQRKKNLASLPHWSSARIKVHPKKEATCSRICNTPQRRVLHKTQEIKIKFNLTVGIENMIWDPGGGVLPLRTRAVLGRRNGTSLVFKILNYVVLYIFNK